MSVLHLAAKFGQLKVIDMLWGKTPVNRTSVKVSSVLHSMSVCLESKRNTKKSTASSVKRSFGRKPRSEILEFLVLILDPCGMIMSPPPTPTVNMIIEVEVVEQEIVM